MSPNPSDLPGQEKARIQTPSSAQDRKRGEPGHRVQVLWRPQCHALTPPISDPVPEELPAGVNSNPSSRRKKRPMHNTAEAEPFLGEVCLRLGVLTTAPEEAGDTSQQVFPGARPPRGRSEIQPKETIKVKGQLCTHTKQALTPARALWSALLRALPLARSGTSLRCRNY